MDEFPTIIGDFYKKKKRENKDPKEYEEWKKEVEKGRDQFIEDKYLHKEKVNVVAIGCFDTVGFEEVVGNHVWGEDYTFHNMALPRGECFLVGLLKKHSIFIFFQKRWTRTLLK